jgi:putative colanic acid biosynthesis acetyltransferase WcaF
MNNYQNLSKFELPKTFRGKPSWYVQLWWVADTLLIKPSPQIFYGWRRFIYRFFGAKIGKNVIIRPSARFTYPWKITIGDNSWIGDDVVLYSLGPIIIGNNVVISQKSYLCTGSHKSNSEKFEIYEKEILIQDQVWIATDVFIGPGVKIAKGNLIGARSSVYKSIESEGNIYFGNPIQFKGKR